MSAEFSTEPQAPGGGGAEGGLADQAQQRAQSLAEQARVRAREQVEQRSSALAERASGAAEDLRGVAEHLRGQGREAPAKAAEQAAQRVSAAADYLHDSDGDRLLRDAEQLGRQRPWAAILGGVAVGVAASRFLKASSSERYHSATSSRGFASPRATSARRPVSAAPVRSPGVPPTPAGGQYGSSSDTGLGGANDG